MARDHSDDAKRLPVERRDDGLYADGTLVVTSSSRDKGGRLRLSDRTRLYLNLTGFARLTHCWECDAFFIGHWAAGFCSPECRAVRKAKTVAKASAKRSERAARWRKYRDRIWCQHCDKEIADYQRSHRFCSNACRQAAYRARLAEQAINLFHASLPAR